VAKNFATNSDATAFSVCHHTFRRAHNRDSQTVQNTIHGLRTVVTAQTRLRTPSQPADDRFAISQVPQVNAQHALFPVINYVDILDVALFEQNARYLALQCRSRDIYLPVSSFARIPDSRQEIRDRIGH